MALVVGESRFKSETESTSQEVEALYQALHYTPEAIELINSVCIMPKTPKKMTIKSSEKTSEETTRKKSEEAISRRLEGEQSNDEDDFKNNFDNSLEQSSSFSDNSSFQERSFSSKSMEVSPTPIRKERKRFRLFEDSLTDTSCSSVLEEDSITSSKSQSFTSSNSKATSYINIYIFIGFIVLSLIAYQVFSFGYNPVEISHSQQGYFETFAKNINELKKEFANQETRLWRTIVSSGRHIFNVTKPDYPAVLLFVSNIVKEPENFLDISSCLANKVGFIFANANGYTDQHTTKIDCGSLDKTSVSNEKLSLDKNLKYYFQDKQYKSIVIDNIELLSPEAALLFHGYCDGDNAPFKDVMIVLVLHTNKANLNTRSAEKLLKDLWEKKLDVDKVGALMSRVANNVAVVNPEPKSSDILNSCV